MSELLDWITLLAVVGLAVVALRWRYARDTHKQRGLMVVVWLAVFVAWVLLARPFFLRPTEVRAAELEFCRRAGPEPRARVLQCLDSLGWSVRAQADVTWQETDRLNALTRFYQGIRSK